MVASLYGRGSYCSTSQKRANGTTGTNGTLCRVPRSNKQHKEWIMRSLLFLVIGIPIPIIILVWLLMGHA